jgi:proteasome assembly chaperone (PAC2) family protein
VLDIAQELGCRTVVTLGGFKTDEVRPIPQVYAAASDTEAMSQVLELGTKIMVGQIFGVAGLTIGLARLRNLKAFSLLIETLGAYPDASAARQALLVLNKFLNFNVDLSKVDAAADETRKILESFGIIRTGAEEKKREEQKFRWFI